MSQVIEVHFDDDATPRQIANWFKGEAPLGTESRFQCLDYSRIDPDDADDIRKELN